MFYKCVRCNSLSKESNSTTESFSGTLYICHGKCRKICEYYYGLDPNDKLTGEMFITDEFKIVYNNISKRCELYTLTKTNSGAIYNFKITTTVYGKQTIDINGLKEFYIKHIKRNNIK